ncbi:geranylgeranyl reductase family protein [Williamsia sp. SKLECPSW1]
MSDVAPDGTDGRGTDPIPGSADVLVVGAGPGGSATAAHAAAAGHDVVLLDAAVFPRDKTCGDGLTPRAVAEMEHLGLGTYLADRPRIVGLAMRGWGASQRVPWPSGRFPAHGSAVARTELDDAVRRVALDRGARMVSGVRAVGAEIRDGAVRSVDVVGEDGPTSIRVGQVIVADGVRSPLGKALGREWHRDTAFGIAARSYATSGRADDEWMGSDLELHGADGELLPGYGWVFPLGDGTVNLGVGALATAKRPAHIALRSVLTQYATSQRDRWQLDGGPQRIASALLPMGGAVSTVAGRNWMLVGDSAACVNPLNGEGIDYALETGRFAAARLHERDHTTAWPVLLTEHYGTAFSAARRLAGVLTVPQAVPVLGRPGIRSQALMSMVVRVMGNLITAEDRDLVARAWHAAGKVSTVVDHRPPFS